MKTMWSLGNFSSSLSFKLFDCQVKPMLLYTSAIWRTMNIHVIETAKLFACKRLSNVSGKFPNNMIYRETGRYPLFIDSTIKSLRHWLKITNLPLNRCPRRAYTMLRNDVETDIQNDQSTGLNNWAKGIKECSESYAFHCIWLNGRVSDKSALLLSFKNRTTGHVREERYSKISASDSFSYLPGIQGDTPKRKIFRQHIDQEVERHLNETTTWSMWNWSQQKNTNLRIQSIKTVLFVQMIWKTNTTLCSVVLYTAT